MQRALAGTEYVASISRRPSDIRARAAFQALAMQLAAPGSLIFDFGAGPGIDAKFFAHHGYRVRAYEIDSRMQDYFREFCGAEIASGSVELDTTEYRDFIAGSSRPQEVVADLVVANFAPLNLVSDLEELFRRLHALTQAKGKILASVLSPYFIGDWRYGWWWRGFGSLLGDGRIEVATAQATVTRRTPKVFAEAASPYFQIGGIWPARRAQADRPVRSSHPLLALDQYLFLMFEKRA
jgi:SAM-dependent methyltransferase